MSDYDSDSDEETFSRSKSSDVLKEKTELLEKYSERINLNKFTPKHRFTKDKALRATVEQVLDPRTIKFLAKLFKNGTITRINGCISTGKEANIYYAENENVKEEFAVKIYKTSILIFKDRDRYIDGEFRFRNSKLQNNPRKMVKIWAEKEFRNLKRIYNEPSINSPKPIDLKSHVLIMQYLTIGNGAPSPKLKDYEFPGGLDETIKFYYEMIILMRLLFQKCRLIHADLSEYNTIIHKGKLYVFDVSQSVEPDHKMSMDFLRMDIKNVNDFFNRIKKINVYPEREIFKFVISPWGILMKDKNLQGKDVEDIELLKDYLNELPLKEDNDTEDEIFRSLHLVSSLHHIEERDFAKFLKGDIDTLGDLVGEVNVKDEESNVSEIKNKENSEEHIDDEDSSDDFDSDEDNSEYSSDEEKESNLKRFQDKDIKKEHKKAVKEAAREKRKNKMKKNVKKKLVKKGKK